MPSGVPINPEEYRLPNDSKLLKQLGLEIGGPHPMDLPKTVQHTMKLDG